MKAACLLLALFAPTAAFADPCTGPLPRRAGETFSGPVRHIIDGDGLCIGASSDPGAWIEVRLADFNAPELQTAGGPEAKRALTRIAINRTAQCVAQPGRNGRVRSHDRVIAVCRINGQALGDAMRSAGVREGGN